MKHFMACTIYRLDKNGERLVGGTLDYTVLNIAVDNETGDYVITSWDMYKKEAKIYRLPFMKYDIVISTRN